MKVFISHKDVDSAQALLLKKEFQSLGVDAYLDVLDSSIKNGGKSLTEHIKSQLNNCTDIIVLMSESTNESWWVPFEIGMSAQIDMPTATFMKENIVLPSYLSYWPRLRKIEDIAKYVLVRKKTRQFLKESDKNFIHKDTRIRRNIETPIFYENLKKELR